MDPRLQKVIDTALEKSPEQRFASAAAVADALAPLAPDSATRKKALRQLLEGTPEEGTTPVPYARTEAASTPRSTGPTPAPAKPAPAPPQVPRTLLSNDYTPISRPNAGVMPLRDPRPSPARTPIGGPASAPARSAAAAKVATPVAQSSPFATGSRPTTSPWSPRPLPLSTRGKCHTRGTLARAAYRWIERAYGPTGRDEVLGMLRTELADSYRSDGFNALVWYDLEALDSFLEAATQSVLRGEALVWERLARENFDSDLASIFRPTRVTEWEVALRRVPAAWGRVFDFGTVQVGDVKGGHATVRINAFDGASLALRYLVAGTFDGMFTTMTSRPKVRITGGEVSFAADLEIDITWQELR